MINEQAKKVLKEINESVPKAWWDMLIKKVWANPVIRELVDRGLADPEVTGETRNKLIILKQSSEYSEETEIIDEEIEKKIDELLTRKVRQATKSGRLPPLKKEDFNVQFQKESPEKEIAKC